MYGRGKDFFVLPFEQIDENVEILPGLDGRKMSKSYNNVIPLFEGGEKALREAIGRIVTTASCPANPRIRKAHRLRASTKLSPHAKTTKPSARNCVTA